MIDKNNRISYVIPAYNSEKTLAETIDSIFDTNFRQGDEVIIVDDFSIDSTISIANNLSKKYYPNIKVIKNLKNKGCPASRNIGIRETKNPYIFSLDSDNVLAKNSIQLLVEKLIEVKADIITFCEVSFFTNNIKKITHKWIFKKGWFALADLFSGNFNPAPLGNYLFTKKSWNKVNGFSELKKGLDEAWIFTFKQLISGSKIYITDNGTYFHRYGHESLTIRGYKDNTEKEILQTALNKDMDIFTEESKKYIEKNTPFWIHNLNKRPIKLITGAKGKNGRLYRTVYGIYCSILKKL